MPMNCRNFRSGNCGWSTNEVVYSGPVRLGWVVDAFEILTRAMDPTNLRRSAAREAVRTTGRLK